jgi:ring-1,2-phenylacetyl-CoA epoxidase subunit PaaC
MEALPDPSLQQPLVNLLLAIADDKLILGHRNSDWTGLAPILEEDIAFSALAQDEIAHAQALYALAGSLIGKTADQLAFGRQVEEYRCAQLIEVPDEFDWAKALVRQFFCDHFDRLRLNRLAESTWRPLASLAKRLAAEEEVHVEHADQWMVRLGTGSKDSHARLQGAIDSLSPLAWSLFEPVEGQEQLEHSGIYPVSDNDHDHFARWERELRLLAQQASLALKLGKLEQHGRGGRRGKHTTHLKELLDEMCEVYRLEPDAAW